MAAPMETLAPGFLTVLSQAPKVFTLCARDGSPGTRLSGTSRPPWSYGATWLPQPRPTSLGSSQGSCSILSLVRSGAGAQWL
jgi:hypothetical protein